MSWSSKTWDEVLPVFNRIVAHPFIAELMNGDLAKDKFEFYIRQDAVYLAEFGRVMAGLAGKFENAGYRQSFLGFANDTVAVEKALHATFRKLLRVNDVSEPSPTCLLYTSFMHSCLHSKSFPEALAAVLPCFWVYKKVGDYILANQTSEDNPYQIWIDTYSGEEFGVAVDNAIAICDCIAAGCTTEQQEKMTEIFVLATRMEWMFWNSAYHLEQWEI